MSEEGALTRFVDEVFRLSGELTTAGDLIASSMGLSAARWRVLGALQDGPVSVATIARMRGLRRQSVRESVMRLSTAGLVSREADPRDARAPLVSLTTSGQNVLNGIEPYRQAWLDRVSLELDGDQVNETIEFMVAVRTMISR